MDEACWEFTSAEDISTPVGGLMIGFLAPVVRVSLTLWLPRPTPCPLRPRRLLSANSGSGSEGGEGGRELCSRLVSLSPCEDGE